MVYSEKVFGGCGCLCLAEGIHLGSDPRIRKRLKFESALEESWSNPLLKAELASWLGQLAQGLTQTSFEDLQEWRSTSLWATCPSAQLLLWGVIFSSYATEASLAASLYPLLWVTLLCPEKCLCKMRSNLARQFQNNKIPFFAVCSYLVEWSKENADKYIQEKRISRWFQAELPIYFFWTCILYTVINVSKIMT